MEIRCWVWSIDLISVHSLGRDVYGENIRTQKQSCLKLSRIAETVAIGDIISDMATSHDSVCTVA